MENDAGWEQQDGVPAQVDPAVDGNGHNAGFEGDNDGNADGALTGTDSQAVGATQSNETEQHRKLFVGGLSFKTEEESLKAFFSQYGEVVDCVVMRDNTTKRPRGFGFITYATISQVDEAQKHRPHTIDGKTVETKRAMPKEESERPDSHVTTKRMWVGGVSETCTEEVLRDHFSSYGPVQSVEIVQDKAGNSRGFAFVNFEDYDSVDKAILGRPHLLSGATRPVEVRKALSRAEMEQVRAQRGGGPMGRGRGRGGSHYPPPPAYGYPSYGGGSYGYYGSPGKPRGGRGGPRSGPYGAPYGASYGGGSGYNAYGYSDYGGYDYGNAWSGSHEGPRGGWPPGDDGAGFGSGYSQYDAGGPMRSSQYGQRNSGSYGGYSGGYGGGYGDGRH